MYNLENSTAIESVVEFLIDIIGESCEPEKIINNIGSYANDYIRDKYPNNTTQWYDYIITKSIKYYNKL